MSVYRGVKTGVSSIIEYDPKKKKPQKPKKIRWSKYKCIICNNMNKKFERVIGEDHYCLQCFFNHGQKVKMQPRWP